MSWVEIHSTLGGREGSTRSETLTSGAAMALA